MKYFDNYFFLYINLVYNLMSLLSFQMNFKDEQACSKQFSVRSNTIFEDSGLPLVKWFQSKYIVNKFTDYLLKKVKELRLTVDDRAKILIATKPKLIIQSAILQDNPQLKTIQILKKTLKIL